MKTLEIRIKRNRTQLGGSTFERLERWASLEGRTTANALERILESQETAVRWQEWLWDQNNPGEATT